MSKPFPGLFITGTDTGVGKTYVAALIARALVAAGRRVGVYKPIASGCRTDAGTLISDDAILLWEAAGRPAALAQVCPQCFAAPLAPHLAAKVACTEVDAQRLRSGLDDWRERSQIVIVEGAGGLMSPVTDDEYVADLAAEFGYPLVIVAPNVLGCINQVLLTLIAAASMGAGLPVAGVVLNNTLPGDRSAAGDLLRATNRAELAGRAGVPVLAEVDFGAGEFDAAVDWFTLGATTGLSHSAGGACE